VIIRGRPGALLAYGCIYLTESRAVFTTAFKFRKVGKYNGIIATGDCFVFVKNIPRVPVLIGISKDIITKTKKLVALISN
jgi:hypothetical protein